jgi:uncharacterized repeat protein (TIGR01451 family)
MLRCRLVTRSLVASLAVLAWVAWPAVAPAQAATVPITVSLYRVAELSCDEGAGEACGNDYYPKFEIDHQGLFDGKDDYCCAHGSDFRTNWARHADVDASHNPVDIHLELWDQDDLSGDDVIHWAKTGDYLDLKFDLNTCTFTGGGLTGQQGAGVPGLAGESETGGEDSARGYFTITTPSCIDLANTTDSDGDGIMNAWESPGQGLDVNDDGTIDLRLGDEPYGALPYRKDLFVDADYMTGDQPQAGAIQAVKDAFAKAPVDPYPDPSDGSKTLHRGVALHVDESKADAVPNLPAILFQTDGPGTQDDFNDLKRGNPVVKAPGSCSGFFGTPADRSDSNCVNILDAKRQVYRYMIFGDSYAESPGSSGSSEWSSAGPQGGNDFIVTLGSWSADGIANAGGRKAAEAATFMHELGHTLSLGHGGDDFTNCKPNYLSVMNYTLQFANRDPSRPLDYTGAPAGTALGLTAATDLDESHLDESRGVYGTPANPTRQTVYGVGGKLRVGPAGNVATDWNEASGNTEGDIAADINYIESIGPKNQFGCSATSPGQTLDGYDDWAHIQYNPRLNTGFFADGARPGMPPELTQDMVLAMTQTADLKIAKSADQAEAAGGDTVSYTTAVTDLGPGTATNIAVTDTMPDATTQHRSLPDLQNGAAHAIAPKFTYAVPCDTTDGTVLTNTVAVTGTDTDGVPDPYVSDNSAKATTLVRAPELTVGSSATGTVNAGEAITYSVTYANTGTGGASGVTITQTLAAGVYYSAALDLGAGPKPTSVTLNGDGTRTLVWDVGAVPAESGDRTIAFTARPGLLVLGDTTYGSNVSVAYKNASGACTFAPVTASASTTVTVVAPSRDPLSQGFWKNHRALWTAEFEARIQATDQRYDTDGDGALSVAETAAGFTPGGSPKIILDVQLLGTYSNLASRRINAGTAIASRDSTSLGLGNVRDAALYAQATLALPVTSTTSPRYSTIIGVLDDINQNKIEVY